MLMLTLKLSPVVIGILDQKGIDLFDKIHWFNVNVNS